MVPNKPKCKSTAVLVQPSQRWLSKILYIHCGHTQYQQYRVCSNNCLDIPCSCDTGQSLVQQNAFMSAHRSHEAGHVLTRTPFPQMPTQPCSTLSPLLHDAAKPTGLLAPGMLQQHMFERDNKHLQKCSVSMYSCWTVIVISD